MVMTIRGERVQATDKHGAQMRGAPRIKVFQPAVLRCGAGAPKRVHLLNVSTGGALVYGDSPPNVGTQVQLACGISLGSARVQWSSGRRFGVAFAKPIGPAEIEAIVSLQDDLIEVIPPAAIPAR